MMRTPPAAGLPFCGRARVLNEEAALERDRLMPLLRLAGLSDEGGIDEQALRRWAEDAAAADGGSGGQPARRVPLLFNILESLGDEVPPELWAGLLAGPPRAPILMPRAAIWRTLGDAAENGRIGETVLLALLTLGEAGPAGGRPDCPGPGVVEPAGGPGWKRMQGRSPSRRRSRRAYEPAAGRGHQAARVARG